MHISIERSDILFPSLLGYEERKCGKSKGAPYIITCQLEYTVQG